MTTYMRTRSIGPGAVIALMVAAVALLLFSFGIYRASHAAAVRDQKITNCQVVLGYSAAQCAKMFP